MSHLILRLLGIERTERLIGHLMRGTAIRRLRRDNMLLGDVHEARHLFASLNAGDSTFCEDGLNCALDRQALLNWQAAEDIRNADPLGLGWTSTTGTIAP